MFCVLTCTVAVTLAPLPSGLVKVQSIAVPELATVQLPATPFGNVPPVYWYGAAEVCIVTPLAASGPLFVTVMEKVNVLVVVFPLPVTVTATAWETARSAPSTVTVNLPERPLPELSWALQFPVVVPTEKPLPEAGVQLTGTAPSTTSVALAT